jgi:uncharacterized membrane protein HdeD (DUF308 family)|tara:strand:- start:263 stop:448 length:186 start_codon:yes stop_codon:yes gene_type:complete
MVIIAWTLMFSNIIHQKSLLLLSIVLFATFLGIFMVVSGIKAEKKKSKKLLEEQSENLDDS